MQKIITLRPLYCSVYPSTLSYCLFGPSLAVRRLSCIIGNWNVKVPSMPSLYGLRHYSPVHQLFLFSFPMPAINLTISNLPAQIINSWALFTLLVYQIIHVAICSHRVIPSSFLCLHLASISWKVLLSLLKLQWHNDYNAGSQLCPCFTSPFCSRLTLTMQSMTGNSLENNL